MAKSGPITYFYSLHSFLPKGGSILFVNSNNNSINFPPSSDWAVGTGDFTIECWYYHTSSSGMALFDQYTAATTAAGNWQFWITGNIFYFYYLDPIYRMLF